MRDGVMLPTVVQLAGESSLCHMHALCLNVVTCLHNLVNGSSYMLLLCCTAFDSLAAFSARRGNTSAGQHPATQCRLQHTNIITACISDIAPTFQAPACLTVSVVLYHASLPWLLCAIWKHRKSMKSSCNIKYTNGALKGTHLSYFSPVSIRLTCLQLPGQEQSIVDDVHYTTRHHSRQ